MSKINLKPILGRLFRWGKQHAEEELEAEVERRLADRLSKTTAQNDTSASSLTEPKP